MTDPEERPRSQEETDERARIDAELAEEGDFVNHGQVTTVGDDEDE